MRENLSKLWDEIRILTEPHAVTLSLEPNPASEPLLSKLNIFSQKPSQLKVVFLHEYNAKTSAWVRGHEKGIEALKAEFGDRLVITNRENVSPEVDAEQILEEVAHDNADVVFTTSIRMRPACLKVAAQHPKTKILNCCLNTPHPLVRTYYPRTFEVNYLLGMLAGILSKTDRVGYVAANPVYGIRRRSTPLRAGCGPSGRTAMWCPLGLCAGGGPAAGFLRPGGYHPALRPQQQ